LVGRKGILGINEWNCDKGRNRGENNDN
jgi:hypothetical protein